MDSNHKIILKTKRLCNIDYSIVAECGTAKISVSTHSGNTRTPHAGHVCSFIEFCLGHRHFVSGVSHSSDSDSGPFLMESRILLIFCFETIGNIFNVAAPHCLPVDNYSYIKGHRSGILQLHAIIKLESRNCDFWSGSC